MNSTRRKKVGRKPLCRPRCLPHATCTSSASFASAVNPKCFVTRFVTIHTALVQTRISFDDFAIAISRGETMPVKPSSELRNTRVRVALPFRGSHLRDKRAYRRSGIVPTSRCPGNPTSHSHPQFFAPNAVHLRHTVTLSAELRTCQTRRGSKHLKTAGK